MSCRGLENKSRRKTMPSLNLQGGPSNEQYIKPRSVRGNSMVFVFPFRIVECRSNGHIVLNDASRAQGYNRPPYRCDNGLATRWYRFSGASGNQMPTSCVPTNRCGTHAPGWLSGRLPSSGQITNAKVCFHWSNNCCRWSTTIRVRNCGAFYVYELKRPPACHLRYCGNSG